MFIIIVCCKSTHKSSNSQIFPRIFTSNVYSRIICKTKSTIQFFRFHKAISPLILHRNYGVSMEYVWTIYGVSSAEEGKRMGI